MDATIQGTIDSLINGFSQYEIKNKSLQAEVDQFCEKIRQFALDNNDIATFFSVYTDSCIPEEYTALISKVAMASMGSVNEDGNPKMDYSNEPDKKVSDLPSVSEFLEQYRVSYGEICKGDNPRAKAAYEAIFDVANQTDDLIEAQIILERERLLWNIVRDGAMDGLIPRLKKMDPLFRATTAKLIGQIDVYNNVESDEELTYKIDVQEVKDVASIADYTSKMHLVACIGTNIFEYLNAKDEVYSWKKDVVVKEAIKTMIKRRLLLRQLLTYLQKYMDMTFDDIMQDEGLKIWLLNPRSIDEYGKEKCVLNKKYLDIITDVINNEILNDISIKEILLIDCLH